MQGSRGIAARTSCGCTPGRRTLLPADHERGYMSRTVANSEYARARFSSDADLRDVDPGARQPRVHRVDVRRSPGQAPDLVGAARQGFAQIMRDFHDHIAASKEHEPRAPFGI